MAETWHGRKGHNIGSDYRWIEVIIGYLKTEMDGHKLYRCLIIIEFKWFSNLYQNRVQGEVPFYRHFTLPRDTWPLVAFDVQTYLQSCIQTYTRK